MLANAACLNKPMENEEMAKKKRLSKHEAYEQYMMELHKCKPAPLNPLYDAEKVKRDEEITAKLLAFCNQEPEPSRAERIRMQAKLYTGIYGEDYAVRMKARYPECFQDEEVQA